jgi:hypothetical protein
VDSDTKYGFTEAPEEYVHVPKAPPQKTKARKLKELSAKDILHSTLLRNNLLSLLCLIIYIPFLFNSGFLAWVNTDEATSLHSIISTTAIATSFFLWGYLFLRPRKQSNFLSILGFIIPFYGIPIWFNLYNLLTSLDSLGWMLLAAIAFGNLYIVPWIFLYLGLLARVWQTKRATQRSDEGAL